MEPQKRGKAEEERKKVDDRSKKPYLPPKLIKFGPVEEFTGSVPS
jgi:hypothetical protein